MRIFREVGVSISAASADQEFVIEGFGNPGVGKSFICAMFQSTYKDEHGPISYHSIDNYHVNFIVRTLCKIALICKSLFFSPRIVKASFMLINSFDNIRGAIKLKLLFNLLLVSSIIVSRRSLDKPLLLDQGVFQAIWSCYYYNEGVKSAVPFHQLISLIDGLLDQMLLTNLIIFDISSDKALIVSRLTNRKIKGSSPLNSIEKSVIKRGLDATTATRHLMHKMAQMSDRLRVLDVKN
tara:strand:+ start:2775 stop:3488 length:714 start_codon:yes stop_codon:yes gene_type:complete